MARPVFVAVDPGKIAGVATYDPLTFDSPSFTSWEAPLWDAVATLESGMNQLEVLALVVEGFVINARSAKLTRGEICWPLEGLGALRYMATVQHAVPFREQSRTDKKFGSDWKLHRLGWYSPSAGGHKNDAARHLLKYLVDEGQLLPGHMALLTAEDADG